MRYVLIFVLGVLLSSCQSQTEDRQSSLDLLDELILEMERQGEVMSMAMDTLAHIYEMRINNRDSLLSHSDPNRYVFDGPFSINQRMEDTIFSSLIILTTTPDLKKAQEEVVMTNFLDEEFRKFYSKNKLVTQIYSNSSNQVSRVFPSYDAKNIVDPTIDVTQFNFFYEADRIHNPSKGLVWIPDAYIDPAGKGWILSLVHPIYEKDSLFAVLGVDFTVDDIINAYLEKYDGQYLLVNRKGDIVAGKSGAIEAISMPPLKNHVYRETVRSVNFRVSDFNLFNSKSEEVRTMAKDFLMNNKDEFFFKKENSLIKAYCRPFQSIDWFLIEIVPKY
ncbi:cache domain-containing protein [Algoriphagus sanaruensis]|uniref:Cache domain-containing protein n=1 Tax=Algoriphagus sanaruensis TaxID=1727163 RepID=A0A142EQC9_9BACT|nr:cache domain-containing protein [Algoriphagus sanaruensis]AMQ57334.1 hypothetical protein AO498_12880 [Algoriphagus sanaruensis]